MSLFRYEGLFRYDGDDKFESERSGEIEAASEDAARRALGERGIKVTLIELVKSDGKKSPVQSLSGAEAEVVNSQVRDLIAGGLPLADGLRAAAAEFDEGGPLSFLTGLLFRRNSRRIRRALLSIAGRLEGGESIEDCLNRRASAAEIKAVLKSGIPSQSAAMAIGEYSGYAETAARARSHVLFLMAYPLLSLAAAVAIIGLFFCVLVPDFKNMFEDFDTELPAFTQMVVAVSDIFVRVGSQLVIGGPIVFAIGLLIFVGIGGKFAADVIRRIPLVGTSFRYLDLARVGHLLAVVLRHKASVPGALRAAGLASNDRRVRTACQNLAASVDAGEKLPTHDPALRGLPLSFLHVAEDDAERDTIADGLHSLARMLEQRSRSLVAMLAGIAQPVLIMLLCCCIGLCFYALFMPFIKLINDLT